MGDKYENKVKIEEIKALISGGDYQSAINVAETVDWSQIKNIPTLGMVSDLYKMARLFEKSRSILYLAYEKQKSRPILKSLCELSIELGDLLNAIEYYKEFRSMAPNDANVYILKYKIYKAQNISIEEQIQVLAELKEHDFIPKWSYELANLYRKAGNASKCVEECNYLILWAVDGKYAIKAYELKAQYEPLNESETYRYELLRQAGGELNIQYSLKENKVRREQPKEFSVGQDISPYNTQSLQAVVAEGIQDVMDPTAAIQLPPMQETPMTYEEAVALDEAALAKESEPESDLLVTQMYNPVMPEAPVGQELEAVEQYVPVMSDTDILGDASSSMAAQRLQDKVPTDYRLNTDTDEIKPITGELPVSDVADNFNQVNYNNLTNTGIIETFHKTSNFDEILSQGADGQISFVVPDDSPVERQITGQISIDDVMKEWERKKKENEAKRVAEIRNRIKLQTDALLDDFDESSKSGLLAQIENAMINAALKEEHDKLVASRPKQIKVSDIDKQPVVTPAESYSEDEGIEEIEEILDSTAELDKIELPKEITAPENTETTDIPEEKEEESPVEEAPEIEEISSVEEESVVEEISSVEEESVAEEVSSVEEESVAEEVSSVEEDVEASEETEPETSDEGTVPETEEVSADVAAVEKETVIEKAPEKNKTQGNPNQYKKTRRLTDLESEHFAAFVHQKATQKQLVNVLDNVTLAPYTGNILVSAEEISEVTTFSKLLVQEISSSDANFTGKVAIISGEMLNRKDIKQAIEKVNSGAMIISEPEQLRKKTVEALIQELNRDDIGVIIIIQGYADILDKLVEKNEGVAEAFNLRIDLKAFDDKTLVEYGKSYAYEQEYIIDELGLLALHTRIADKQTADHEVTLAEIEQMVDEAIYYADKKTPTHFFDILFGKRYDEQDMIILREKDFMHY